MSVIVNLDELTKRVWPDWEVAELHNSTAPGLDLLFRKGDAQLGGSGFYFGINTQGNHGYAHIRPLDPLPAGRQTLDRQASVFPVILAGQAQLDGLAMAISSRDAGAFARAYDHNVSSLMKQMVRYKNQCAYRDGSGVQATFVTPVNDSIGPHVMNDVTGIVEGQVYDVIDATATTRHTLDAKVVVVDWVNKTLTFDKAITNAVDAGDRLFIADSQSDSGAVVQKDPIGLAGSILATGEYLGISRDAEANWRSISYTANKFLDEQVIGLLRTRINVECGLSLQELANDFMIVCHPMQLDVLFKLCIPRIQYSAGQGFELGHDGSFSFGGLKFATDWHCPPGTAYLGDWSKSNTLYTPNGELHIDTKYNGAALKWLVGYDQGAVVILSYYAFANRSPNCFARATGLTEVPR